MRKLTLDGLLYLRSIAKTTRDNLEASHAVRMYIAERDPLAQNALAYFNDTFSNDFVPFYTFRKYQDALRDCDEEAADELTRLNDEFERTDVYERQIEIFNHLNQLRFS